jgi:hypothetical protein
MGLISNYVDVLFHVIKEGRVSIKIKDAKEDELVTAGI